jgi:ADP-heptose:LPS heptosyltransferase
MLTAAVRDLHKAHGDKFDIAVETSCAPLWQNNPYLSDFDARAAGVQRIDCDYPLIHRSNSAPYHFIHGFAQFLEQKLRVRIPLTEFKGDIHVSELERSWMSQVQEMGIQSPFWIVLAGGKYDYTAKWWSPAAYQAVVDHFRDRILFVQCGEKGHWHPPLRNVIDLIGKTDLRQFIRLVYHSIGVLCPVTFAMHAAAAVPAPPSRPRNRACVVVAGGREPSQWEAYPHHRFLSNNGALRCCEHGGCWKSRCQPVGDGDRKDKEGLCDQPVQIEGSLKIAKCMDMIKPADVIRAIESYYEGGVLTYCT